MTRDVTSARRAQVVRQTVQTMLLSDCGLVVAFVFVLSGSTPASPGRRGWSRKRPAARRGTTPAAARRAQSRARRSAGGAVKAGVGTLIVTGCAHDSVCWHAAASSDMSVLTCTHPSTHFRPWRVLQPSHPLWLVGTDQQQLTRTTVSEGKGGKHTPGAGTRQ